MEANEIRCSKCNNLIFSHAKFCGYCGEPAGISCPRCDVLNPADGRYCYDCGQRLHPPPWELDRDRPTYALRDPVVTPPPSSPPAGAEICQRCGTTSEPGAVHCYQCRFLLVEEPEPDAVPLNAKGAATSYISPRTRANWTIALVVAVCLVSVLYLWVLDRQLDSLTDPINSQVAILEIEEDVTGVATLLLFVYVAAAVAFLMWQFRVSGNLRRFGMPNQRFSPEWGVVAWFIPIVNLFLSYQVIAEIWRGSTATDQEKWDKLSAPFVMKVWWGCHLLGGLILLPIGEKVTQAYILMDMLGAGATGIAGVILICLVKQITDRQEDRAHYASHQIPIQTGGTTYVGQNLDTGAPKFIWLWPRLSAIRKFLYLLAIVAVVAVTVNLLSSADNNESMSKVDPSTPPEFRYIEEKRFMLDLINEERGREGLKPVVLGSNIAAQLHAETSIEECFASHWNLDGLKPYMRYSLAGGYQANAENVAGSDYCPSRYSFYAPVSDIREEIRETMAGWMDSPGHREAIMDPWVKKVNIGLEWSTYNFSAVQQFEGDYIEYLESPTIAGGVLTVAGRVKNGLSIPTDERLVVAIFYDPPPQRLTRGQIARTYCYDKGTPVAILREPPPKGSYYIDDETDETFEFCPDPHDVSPDALPPASDDEAYDLWQEARRASLKGIERTVPLLHITASTWVVRGNTFSVSANVVAVTNRYGPGVYTISILVESGGEDVLVSDYSTFHEIRPPGSN